MYIIKFIAMIIQVKQALSIWQIDFCVRAMSLFFFLLKSEMCVMFCLLRGREQVATALLYYIV